MNRLPRALAGVSALFLLATAYLHATGTRVVRRVLSASEIKGFFADALPTIWLFFSWHLVAIAVPLLWAMITQPRWFVSYAMFCAAVVLGDFFWVFSVAGWFPGTVMLMLVVAAQATTIVILMRAGSRQHSEKNPP